MRLSFSYPLILVVYLSIIFTANAQIVPGVGAGTEDPKKILAAAEQAMGKLQRVAYEAGYEGTGAFAVRSSSATGKIRLEKLERGNPLTARIFAEGDHYPAGKETPEHFVTSFDGNMILRLGQSEKMLVRKTLSGNDPAERNFGFVTQHLGVGTDQLIMYEFILDRPFAQQLSGELEYEGRASLAGVLCHVIYVEFDRRPDGRSRKQRWFIGAKDNLPRKVEELVADDKGRAGSYSLMLSDLRPDFVVTAQTFSVRLPQGFKRVELTEPKLPDSLSIGEAAPEWTLADPGGKLHSLSDHRGKIVMLDFWATWCAPCVRALPEIQALHDKFQARGVKVFGINAWEESNAPAYFKDKGYTYELLLNGENAARSYRVSTLPAIYVIGADGKIIYRGTLPGADLTGAIEHSLAGQK